MKGAPAHFKVCSRCAGDEVPWQLAGENIVLSWVSFLQQGLSCLEDLPCPRFPGRRGGDSSASAPPQSPLTGHQGRVWCLDSPRCPEGSWSFWSRLCRASTAPSSGASSAMTKQILNAVCLSPSFPDSNQFQTLQPLPRGPEFPWVLLSAQECLYTRE